MAVERGRTVLQTDQREGHDKYLRSRSVGEAQKQKYTGTYVSDGSIYVRFQWQPPGEEKKRKFEERYICDKINHRTRAEAAELRAQIKSLIDSGLFTVEKYIEFFPYTKKFNVEKIRSGVENAEHIFFNYAQKYLDLLRATGKKESTIKKYKQGIKTYWGNLFPIPVMDINEKMIHDILLANDFENKSASTFNNAMIYIRGILKIAIKERVIQFDPTIDIDNAPRQEEAPDPFEPEEVEAIIGWLENKSREHEKYRIWLAYYLVAFGSGLRNPQELAGLQWDRIKQRQGQIQVNQVMSDSRLVPETKTNYERFVDIDSRTQRGLDIAAEITFDREDGFVFSSYRYKKPFTYGKPQRAIWKEIMEDLSGKKIEYLTEDGRKEALRFRPRENTQTRHTNATIRLNADQSINYAAQQMGHSPHVFMKKYARWLNRGTKKSEIEKLNKFNEKTNENVGKSQERNTGFDLQ